MKFWIPLLLIVAGLGLWLHRPPTPSAPPILVAANTWPGNEALLAVRRDKAGNYKSTRLGNATEVAWAFKNRSADLVSLTLDETLRLAQDEPDLVVLTLIDWSAGADGLVMKDASKGLGGLRSSRLAVESTALGQYLFNRICEQGGIHPSELQLVPLPVDAHFKAWKEYRIDAAINFEPELSRLRREGGQLAWDSRQVPGEIVDCLVTRRSLLRDKKPQIEAFLGAWQSELALIEARDPDQMARIGQKLGLDPDETRAAFAGVKLLQSAEAEQHLHSELLARTAERIQEQMLRSGLIRRVIPLRDLLPPRPGIVPEKR
ncbi:MAG: hypothetical protein RL095_1067 [Verrucomicrobiota bacterium]